MLDTNTCRFEQYPEKRPLGKCWLGNVLESEQRNVLQMFDFSYGKEMGFCIFFLEYNKYQRPTYF